MKDSILALQSARIGFAVTGSFCTFERAFEQMGALSAAGAEVFPILSENAYQTDTRFYTAALVREIVTAKCGRPIWHTLGEVEPIGPKKLLDLLIIAPCTGNTLGKLAGGIIDTSPVMAAKSQLRNGRPVLLAIATNDGLALAAKNIGMLMTMRNVYFVPYGQDDPQRKPYSLVAHMDALPEAAGEAIQGRQIQPILRVYE